MSLSNEEKGTLLFELSYLYGEYGGALAVEESDLIKDALAVAQGHGTEQIADEVWPVLLKIYKKYENKELDDVGEDDIV
jgi:hypothetical protein